MNEDVIVKPSVMSYINMYREDFENGQLFFDFMYDDPDFAEAERIVKAEKNK